MVPSYVGENQEYHMSTTPNGVVYFLHSSRGFPKRFIVN
jgi:hypothetical protein